MGIEIIGKLTQKNNGDFKLVDLEDVDYDGTGKSAKQELENKIEDVKNSLDAPTIKADIQTLKDNEITLVKDETSMEGIKDNEYPTLTTQDKTLIGSINEVNAQYKDIANEKTQKVVKNNIQETINSLHGEHKNVVLNKNLELTEPISLTSNLTIRGINDVEITGVNIVAIKHVNGNLKNITIENITFNGTDSFDIEGAENITIRNCKFLNINGVGIGWFKGCKNITILNNYVENCSNMGIKIEGTSYSPSSIINVENNLIVDAGDNGIAVRAMNDSIAKARIVKNTIINSGKAGIKLTIESSSQDSSNINDCIVSGNIINGWGKNIYEDAISCNNYKTEEKSNNISIVNNVISSISNNTKQRNYIGVNKCSNVSIVGNNCRGEVLWNGIWAEIASEITINSNRIEGAGKESSNEFVSTFAGISLICCKNSNISNNIIKNTGTTKVNLPGIVVNKSKNNVITNNRIFDDQTTKTQSKGIDETTNGGNPNWSSDNIFIGNLCAGNIGDSSYSDRSLNINNKD